MSWYVSHLVCILLLLCISCTVHGLKLRMMTTKSPISDKIPTDLILSSGFCAFARQAGVLAAVEDFGIHIDRCVGTSSGSLAASLYCAGFTPLQIADELSKRRPISLCQPSLKIHKGAFSLNGLIAHLRTLLPKDFTQLQRKLAIGVFETSTGTFRLIEDGDLPQAVAASCAIPYIFQPVAVSVRAGSPPVLMADGGVKDRLGLGHWAEWAGASDTAPRRAGTLHALRCVRCVRCCVYVNIGLLLPGGLLLPPLWSFCALVCSPPLASFLTSSVDF